jgi:hypothetical protein
LFVSYGEETRNCFCQPRSVPFAESVPKAGKEIMEQVETGIKLVLGINQY